MASLLTVVAAVDPETALSPCGVGYSPIWPWSYHQRHPPWDLGEVMSVGALSNMLAGLDPLCGS